MTFECFHVTLIFFNFIFCVAALSSHALLWLVVPLSQQTDLGYRVDFFSLTQLFKLKKTKKPELLKHIYYSPIPLAIRLHLASVFDHKPCLSNHW